MTKEQVFDQQSCVTAPDILRINGSQLQISDLLGPVVLYWLCNLHQHIRYFDDGKTTFLYCARAGVRIRELYRDFLRVRGLGADPGKMLWISRIATCKGVFAETPADAAGIIQREFADSSLQVLLESLLRQRPDILDSLHKNKTRERACLHASEFANWVSGSSADAKRVNSYLREASQCFKGFPEELSAGNNRIVLIDSGWQGTTQDLLAKAHPDYSWFGLYFGVNERHATGRRTSDKVIGTVFSASRYESAKPETAFLQHRHLIEALLEPNAPSVEEVAFGDHRAYANDVIAANATETPDPVDDADYLAVRAYIRASSNKSLVDIQVSYQRAMTKLAQLLTFPKRNEVAALSVKPRSADFGKTEKVPTVLLPEFYPSLTRAERLSRALWTPGQIALEYPAETATDLQIHNAGLSELPEGRNQTPVHVAKPVSCVAIITRTKNRPLLLKRAAQSVAAQTYGNIIWVVVNDGGDPEAVRQILGMSYVEQSKIIRLDHEQSLGMEAAGNAGIAAVQSDYVLIHDDDDSLDPDFVEKTVTFLDAPSGQKFGGVITKSIYVSEEICADVVIEHDKTPYNDWVNGVQLAEMAAGNFFPPISFLYRRDIWEKTGGYCENLPVLGDWKFNLDFLCHADIGFIDDALAYYHHRDRVAVQQNQAYSNSVLGAIDKHREYAPIVRNMIIRDPGKYPVLSGLMANAYIRPSVSIRDCPGRVSPVADVRVALPAGTHADDRSLFIHEIRNCSVFGNLVSRALLAVDWAWRMIFHWAVSRGFGPPEIDPAFDELKYLKNNADVAEAVAANLFSSGYEHYLLHGIAEGRLRPGLSPQSFE